MGLKNLPAITAALLAGGRPADTPAAVVQEGTTAAQRVVRGRLDTIAADAAALRAPAIVVVGEVVRALLP
jgi:uroporphyrin-III C-methyltransferase/precorrin-2 dehydrogenase/sirohydrochlorin ferrochelatase